MAARARAPAPDPMLVELAAWRTELERWRGGLAQDFREERTSAADYRNGIRTVISALSTSIQTLTARIEQAIGMLTDVRTELAKQQAETKMLTNSVADHARDIGEIKPLATEFRTVRDEAAGAGKLVVVVWTVGGGALGAAALLLLQYLLQHG